jgi:protein O-GlcNAc transferase
MLQWLFKKKTVDATRAQGNIAIVGSASEITTDGRKVDAAIAIAAQLQRAGRYLEADASFKNFLAANPENSEALRMLGALKLQTGQHKSAAELLSRAIMLNPLQPNAHSELGKVYLETNRIEEAKSCFVKALELEPNLAEAHYKLGNVHRIEGELDAALACYQKAVSIDPNYSEAHNNAGVTYEAKGQRNEAIASYRKALAINPMLENAQYNLGLLLWGIGNAAEALECLNRTIALNPNSADAHNLKGVVHQQRREFTEAIAAYKKALSIDAGLADAHNCLGVIYQLQGNLSDAIESFRGAISCRSEFAAAHANLGMTLLQMGMSDEAIPVLRHAVNIDPDFAVGYSNYLFCLSHDENASPEAVFAEHRAFGDHFEAPFRTQWSRHGNLADPDRKLRVGFVSADLNAHPVSFFVEPLWAALDSKLVEIWVYSNNPVEEAVTLRLQGLAHRWRKVHAMSDEELARKIREDEIDILFDLSGHTANNRLLTFVRRPAPVQVSWIANPNTTGLTAIDYYLADQYSAPPGLLDSLFTEKIVQLPSGAVFQPFDASPPVNELPAVASGTLTFGTFARNNKLTNGVIRLWSRVLTAVPGSRMLLVGVSDDSRKANITEQFSRNGVVANQLVFHPRVGMKEYLALHQQVDIILDTFPFAGLTTSCHAVWMGVPVLTLAGKTMSSRSGAIVNANVGLPAFTTESAEEFVAQAVHWSQRLPELAELRASLRSKAIASPMYQPHTVARWLETALRTMWQRWCAGKPAQSFSVSANQ